MFGERIKPWFCFVPFSAATSDWEESIQAYFMVFIIYHLVLKLTEIAILPEVDIRCWADSVGLANALNLVHKATFLKDRNLLKLIWRLLLEIILTASGFSPNFKFQNS